MTEFMFVLTQKKCQFRVKVQIKCILSLICWAIMCVRIRHNGRKLRKLIA